MQKNLLYFLFFLVILLLGVDAQNSTKCECCYLKEALEHDTGGMVGYSIAMFAAGALLVGLAWAFTQWEALKAYLHRNRVAPGGVEPAADINQIENLPTGTSFFSNDRRIIYIPINRVRTFT